MRGWPRLDLRLRLFLVSVVLIFVVGSVSALWLRVSLRGLLEDRIESELLGQASAAKVTLEGIAPDADVTRVDPIANALGAPTDVRFTFVTANGRVLGDSHTATAQVSAMDNHATRPEIAATLETGQPAISRRHSDTVGVDMMYVAMPYRTRGHQGVVRTSLALADIQQVLATFDVAVAVAALIGLLLAVFMSGLASELASRDVRALLTRLRVILAQSADEALPAAPSDPLGDLAGGVQHLADRMRVAMAQASAERGRLEALLASMSEAVLALDPDNRVSLANPAALALLGLDAPPIGRELLALARVPDLLAVVASAQSGVGDAAEVSLPGDRIVLATARPLRDRAGCVLVLHDVTEMRHLERVRRDFVANVSHELRTPVSIIRANAESLADGALEEPAVAHSFLAAITRNAERLGALISDLLDLSRIEAGRLQLELTPTPVALVAMRAIESLHDRARAAGCELHRRVNDDCIVVSDPLALEHVLTNLLENAIKYAGSGGQVDVTAHREGDQICIAVQDNGPGIPQRHRSRVFERFYRVDAGRARQQGGTGLGLAIVKNLVDAMGGTVGLDPRQPQGSSFWVRLPAVD